MIRVSFRTDFKILVHILDGTCIFFIVIEANAKYKGLTCPISKPISYYVTYSAKFIGNNVSPSQ